MSRSLKSDVFFFQVEGGRPLPTALFLARRSTVTEVLDEIPFSRIRKNDGRTIDVPTGYAELLKLFITKSRRDKVIRREFLTAVRPQLL